MKLLSKADLRHRWNCTPRELRVDMTDDNFPEPEPNTKLWSEDKIIAFEADFYGIYTEPVEHEVDLSFGGEVTR